VEVGGAQTEIAAMLRESLEVRYLTRIDPGKDVIAGGVGLVEQLGRGQADIGQDRLGLFLESDEPLLQQVASQGQSGQQEENQGQDQEPAAAVSDPDLLPPPIQNDSSTTLVVFSSKPSCHGDNKFFDPGSF
jgi:hypothetical protein